jgi:MoxR-like ATPase
MAQADLDTTAADQAPEIELESSTYEIIRNRLAGFGNELRGRLDQLNHARKEVFGSIETRLIATERITTAHNCVPRDMVAVGNRFLFGYNVHFGLKTETDLTDVFAIYELRDNTFHELDLGPIQDERFIKNFKDIYRYYKDAVFVKFFVKGPLLYMVFRVGKSVTDIKTFKWSIQGGELTYIDNRSDHEVRYPPQHEFEWVRTHRDLHQTGAHPHISIEDRVFVETVGGDLTIKIENNTDSGEGIYSEPVENKDQTLDDAEIYYAVVGNIILLKIKPYQEREFRYFVFNEKIQQARRLDTIAHACVLLPDDHGLIFSNGYYLQNGEAKTFESDLRDMLFERRITAPNGEDYLYVFYNRQHGVYILLQYNLIEQRVETPIVCNGYTFFEAGELVCFKCHEQPQKHHAVQIWQTPYVGEDYVPHADTDSYLFKVGNRDIVRGMAECHEVLNLIGKQDTYSNLYVDLVKETGDVIDSYFWIDKADTFNLKEPLSKIKEAASAAVAEFEKVVRVRKNTADQTRDVSNRTRDIINAVHHKRFDNIGDFVGSLGDLRRIRGDIISLRDLRYVDKELVDALEQDVATEADRLAERCVRFLLQDDALTPYEQQVDQERAGIDGLTKVTDAKKVDEAIAASAAELEMLIEIVSNLKIEDATHRTTIIDNISAIFSNVNQARAALKRKTKELLSVEGIAEFNSQMKLLNQGVVNYLDICDTPDKCEEFLTKVMIQLEELEGRFAEFDEFVLQLTEKREEVYNAFETRKLALIEARNKRANALMSAAERILKGIKSRVESFDSINDINGYFASDLMIEKVRDIVKQLGDLDDSVKVDDIQSRLKTIREDAVRQLKDRQELFVGGENVIRMGNHHFSVNVQALDLTTVLRNDQMCLHLTGTNFFEAIRDENLLATRDVWQQEVISENREVYRAEYLAYLLLKSLEGNREQSLEDVLRFDEKERLAFVQQFMSPRYNEAYVKGVHDHDGSLILAALMEMQSSIGLLRYHTRARALATVFWDEFLDTRRKNFLSAKLQGVGTIARAFPDSEARALYVSELRTLLDELLTETGLFPESFADEAAEYLFDELVRGGDFAVSRTAADLYEAFGSHLSHSGYDKQFADSLKAVRRDLVASYWLARDWAQAFIEQRKIADEAEYFDELTTLLLHGKLEPRRIVDGQVTHEITGLIGSHPVLEGGTYRLNFNQFNQKLARFQSQVVPRFIQYHDLKKEIVDRSREAMRLDEFRPKVMTSFVRNRLIDTVYLPLIGDNLAKQIGVVGEQKRTDLMGLLLLVSPPGYGKTTLMEYVANRLGVIFMKINGPAIGHQVTSLDPTEAPNAGAREEIEKLNLSLEMGDNVMIYLDDIQHCNPEFLQKFISLCDAQRKIEGVYKGRTRTYDLRGRKVAVVMAGNPYTESGEKFQIPDMLSNRADIYNLGEIIGDTAEAFEMSYLENSLTSNPTLSKLATRSQKDVYAIIKMAESESREGIDLEGNYSVEELNELVATMRKLIQVRDVILKVNREYIRSAAQADEYRTEPAFKLQGSYRNMNRIAEKVVPIMNDAELQTLIVSNYENDAQTLTSGTESNLLKFKELIGILTDEEAQRWNDIKKTFRQNVRLKGLGSDDKVAQVIVQLSAFADGLDAIRGAMTDGVTQLLQHDGNGQSTEDVHYIEELNELLDEVRGITNGLQTIGEALSGGMMQALELARETAARPALPAPAAPVAPQPSDDGQEADDSGVTVEADPNAPRGAGQRITVVNKIPRSLLNVMEQQFKLMHGWMEPIFRTTHAQSAEVQELKQLMEGCLKDYNRLLGRLEDARVDSGREK